MLEFVGEIATKDSQFQGDRTTKLRRDGILFEKVPKQRLIRLVQPLIK
jgi:hypothetical protein